MPINWSEGSLDSLSNFAKRLGGSKDPATYTRFSSRVLTGHELDALYSNNALVAKIVDIPIDDALQKGRYINDPGMSDEDKDRFYRFEQEIDYFAKVGNAAKWARLYGGALVLIGLRGQNLAEPLDVETIKPGELDFLLELDSEEISGYETNVTDITKSNYRKPEYYMINGTKVHHTRAILFDGINAPYRIREMNKGFGISLIQKIYDGIFRAEHSAQSADSLLWNYSCDIVRVPGLFEKVSSSEEETALYNRFNLANMMRSNLSIMVLDSEEDFQRIVGNLAGVVDLVRQNLDKVAADADIPATRLLGQSPNGLNATGASDTLNYFEKLSAIQEIYLMPKMTKLDKVILKHLGIRTESYSFKFNPLSEMTPLQLADLELKNAQRDQIYSTIGVVANDIIAEQLRIEETYETLDEDYTSAIREMELKSPDESTPDDSQPPEIVE